MSFVNLHQHTTHSLLDGCADIEPLVSRAKELEMPALAITDHGTMSGTLEFYLECKKQGVNPIVGVEMYLDDSPDRKGKYRHIVLLAKNLKGYRNLLKIVSEAHAKGFYYRPRTTTKMVMENGEGLIVSTACMGGLIGKDYGSSDKNVIAMIKRWKKRFGDDFYIELQLNEIPMQANINAWLLDLAKRTKTKPILTLDSHYVDPSDVLVQDFILAVRDRITIDQVDKVKYTARRLSLMGAKDIWKISRKWKTKLTKDMFGKLIRNTEEVAEKVDLTIPTGKFHIPKTGKTPAQFEDKVWRRAKKLGLKKKKYIARLKHELEVIKRLKFHDYFGIVDDLVQWCRSKDIFVGPARGSVAGSLVSLVLGITKVDPIRHGLLFERFLNASRVDMPDIDLDFDANKREQVFDYIREKYGRNKVARVITMGRFGSVGAIRDIGRVFKLPIRPINELADEIYKSGGIDDAYKNLSGRLKDFWRENRRLIKFAKKISNLVRNIGVHPCGTIVAPKAVWKYCPLQRVKGEVVSAYSEGKRSRELSEIGLVKLDVLGLNTCSIISDALTLIKKRTGKSLAKKIWTIDLEDEKLLQQVRRGRTIGMFQFETDAATSLLRKIQPRNFEEIAALNAINRPGPLGSGAVQRFLTEEGMGIDNEIIESVLEETRGVLVYQEQVMQILHRVAGYPLIEADNIRKLAAHSMYKKSQVKKLAKEFVKKCSKNIGKEDARELWKIIKAFTQYSFNKSHAISYTYLFFQTLFLKNYFPAEFFASLLSNTATGVKKDKKRGSEQNKIYTYIGEARRFGILIQPPDINRSGVEFTLEKKRIRFGLTKIKGIKDPSAQEIIDKRPYSSFTDFLDRVSGKVHKGKIVALIQAGAFDSMDDRQTIKRQFNSIRKDQIFDLEPNLSRDAVEAFGFVLLHPFFEEPVKDYLLARYCVTSVQLKKYKRWERAGVAGIVIDIATPMSGKSSMIVKIQDHRGDMSVYLDEDAEQQYVKAVKHFNLIFISGRFMGGNRILCQGGKDKIINITKKVYKLVEGSRCRKRKGLA